MAPNLQEIVSNARKLSSEREITRHAGKVYRGSGYPHAKAISIGVLEQRLLAGTLDGLFPGRCSEGDGVCYRSTIKNTSSVFNGGLVSALLMSSVHDEALAGTWKENIYVGKSGISKDELKDAVKDGEQPTLVCYLTVRR
jgi:hypothetical protein